MIVGSEKRNRQLAFELENSHVCEKRSNTSPLYIYIYIYILTGHAGTRESSAINHASLTSGQ